MNPRYEQVEEGKWYRWDRKNNRDRCCDCQLVHIVDYRVVTRGKRHYVETRVKRDNRATAASRKRTRIVIRQSHKA